MAGRQTIFRPMPTVITEMPGEEVELNLYFDNENFEPERPGRLECGEVYGVKRQFSVNDDLMVRLLRDLWAGPNGYEEVSGYWSRIKPESDLPGIVYKDKVVEVTLDAGWFEGETACDRLTAMNQIRSTLMQLPGVDEVVIEEIYGIGI